LDRSGALGNDAFLHGTSFAGTDGRTYNNHIPSNCLSCHGTNQQYDPAGHAATKSSFLPFDLDQFEYQNVPGRTRQDQLAAFNTLNQIVRKFGVFSNTAGGASVQRQIDLWY